MAGAFETHAQFTNELRYQLPQCAHDQLSDTRDELRLLADLALRLHSDGELQLQPNALARCFNRLAEQLSDVLYATVRPSPNV